MDAVVEKFEQFIKENFTSPLPGTGKPDLKFLESLIQNFRTGNASIWDARASVLRHLLDPKVESGYKDGVLSIYKNLMGEPDISAMLALEAARAAVIFEEPDLASEYLDGAKKLLNFYPEITGVMIKSTQFQENPSVRLACAATSASNEVKSENVDEIEKVKLNSETGVLDTPQFISEEDEYKCTSLLNDEEYLVILIEGDISCLRHPATSRMVSEQVLPYVRRITETEDMGRVHWSIQLRALYERSMLEVKDIQELERGTLQLMKISDSIHASKRGDSLKYFHQIEPIPWRTVDDVTARRLVAMGDFGNAVPLYEGLGESLDLGLCLSALDRNEEAYKILSDESLNENSRALMLKGDISGDPQFWQSAWEMDRLPKAKLRLAEKAAVNDDNEGSLGHLEILLASYPTNYDGLYLAGMTSIALQNWEKAAQYFRRALAVNDEDPKGWANLATALVHMDQAPQAHHALKQSMRVNQNSAPELPVLTNFVALSAQLDLWDDVVVGFSDLAESGERGSAPFVSRVSGVLPKLVANFVKRPYNSDSVNQKLLVNLLRNGLPKIVSEDDPLVARLSAQVDLWSGRYQAGLKSYGKAFDSVLKFFDRSDERSGKRVELYGKEYIVALAQYGDKEGRIEGSKAYPNWETEKAKVEAKLSSLNVES